jgi:hypothetical protein
MKVAAAFHVHARGLRRRRCGQPFGVAAEESWRGSVADGRGQPIGGFASWFVMKWWVNEAEAVILWGTRAKVSASAGSRC